MSALVELHRATAGYAGNVVLRDPSNAVVPGAVPDAPTGVTAARSGSGSVSVSFTPGNNNGFVASSFTVTCASPDAGAVTPVTNSGPGSPVVLNGLTNGDTYTCRVHGTNSVGAGPDSAAAAKLPCSRRVTMFSALTS